MDDIFGRTLLESSRLWRTLLNRLLAEHGLTVAGWAVLHSLLRQGEGVTQKELAARLLVEGPTLVKLLDNLTCKGWIFRQISAADRRANTVWLTDEARASIDGIEQALARMNNEVLETFSEEQVRQLQAMLESLKERLELRVSDAHEGHSYGPSAA